MKSNKIGLLVIFLIVLTSCQQEENAQQAKELREVKEKELVKNADEINNNIIEIPVYTEGSKSYFPVDSFFKQIKGSYQYNKVDKILSMDILDHHYKLIYGVPVLSDNGWLHPNDDISFILKENEPYVSLAFLKDIIGLEVKKLPKVVEFIWDQPRITKTASRSIEKSLKNIDHVIELLSPLQSPIRQAKVDTVRSHLPGARRAYRNGYHEGMDWYGYSSGVPMNRQTEIYAMGDGVVVRADHSYKGYSSIANRNKDLQMAKELSETPEYILDKLRGRQVWIQYDSGAQARFSHMDRINNDLQVGDKVTANTLIGYVGNSGTSGEVKKDDSELHLHMDLLIQGELFWEYLSEDEVVKVLKTIFE